MKDDNISNLKLDQVQELYEMLCGRSLPCGVEMGNKSRPKLTEERAFGVIWFLQEHLRIVPDHFERCDNCGSIYDSHYEGHHNKKSGKGWCGNCEHMDSKAKGAV